MDENEVMEEIQKLVAKYGKERLMEHLKKWEDLSSKDIDYDEHIQYKEQYHYPDYNDSDGNTQVKTGIRHVIR